MANISAKLSLNVPAITALCKGEPGSSVLNGNTAPTALIGNDGDFYLDTVTYQMYGPKAGVWGTPVQLSNNFLGPKWNSSYDSLSALSGRWDGTYTTVYSNSARWSGVFSTTRAYSGDWNDAYNTAYNVYTLVNTESAGWGITSSVFTTVNANSANWDAAYTAIVDNGDKWNSTYSSVYANSAAWSATADFDVRALTGNWENTYSIVYANSALWDAAAGSAGADLAVRSLTGNWEDTYNNVNANSSRWEGTYTSFNTQSANNINVFSAVYPNSASWIDTNTTVWTYSASWGNVINTDRYDDTYLTVYTLSGNWESTATSVAGGEQYWWNTYTTMATYSGAWESTKDAVNAGAGLWYDTTDTVRSNSANWGLADLTVACSDESTSLTVTTSATTFRMPYAMYLNNIRASVNTAPVGSTIIIDAKQNGTSLLSTLLTIDANEETSTTAAVPVVISNPNLTDDSKITIGINQVGSTTPGTGLKLTFKGYRV